MQSLTTAKVIAFNRATKDFDATFDGQYIGSFPTYSAAENALNDHVLLLCEQGLVDLPLAALAEQALLAANPVSDPEPEPVPWDAGRAIVRAAQAMATPALPLGWNDDPFDDGPSQAEQAEAAARWTPCADGWEQFTPHPFDSTKTVRLFQPRI